VTFIDRGAHLQALQPQGLQVDSVLGDFVIHPMPGNGRPTTGRRRGTVFVTVKAWRVPAVAEAIRPMVRPGTCVVSLQNDAEAQEQLAAVLGAASVVGGVCDLVNFMVAPGHIRHAAAEPLPSSSRLLVTRPACCHRRGGGCSRWRSASRALQGGACASVGAAGGPRGRCGRWKRSCEFPILAEFRFYWIKPVPRLSNKMSFGTQASAIDALNAGFGL
jgi:hypothetical protein